MKQCTCYALRAIDCTCKPAKYGELYTSPTAKQEQGEPVIMRMPKVGDRVVCIEDEDLGTVQSLTAGGSPDIKFDDGSHGTYMLREFSELFRYADTTPQQRTWVGLTDEEVQGFADQYWEDDNMTMNSLMRSVEAKLKEKNT
jgi:hypothetical protein